MEDVLNEFFENTWEEDYWDYAIPLSRKDIQSIVEYDTSFDYKKELNAYGREPLWLKAHKIPDFLELEREFSIELNPRIKEYFSRTSRLLSVEPSFTTIISQSLNV